VKRGDGPRKGRGPSTSSLRSAGPAPSKECPESGRPQCGRRDHGFTLGSRLPPGKSRVHNRTPGLTCGFASRWSPLAARHGPGHNEVAGPDGHGNGGGVDELSPLAVLVLGRVARSPTPLNPMQVAGLTGTAVSNVRAAVDELVALGSLRLTPTGGVALVRGPGTGRAGARRPSTAARHTAAREQWQLDDALARESHHSAEGLGSTQVYGADEARATLTGLTLAKPVEMLSVSPAPVLQGLEAAEAPARSANLAMLSNGTRSDWVTDNSRLDVPVLRAYVRELARRGEAVYTAPNVTQRIAIFDRQIALVPIDPHDHFRGCVVVRSPAVISGLVSLYQEVVARATRLEIPPEIGTHRHDVLVMLAAGDKDEAIARKLHVSARTVRRAISTLMVECGADSRFQLAIAAVRLGWLSADDLTAKGRPSGQSRE
jgi:DNA-binding CsgD family transcriptional regulator